MGATQFEDLACKPKNSTFFRSLLRTWYCVLNLIPFLPPCCCCTRIGNYAITPRPRSIKFISFVYRNRSWNPTRTADDGHWPSEAEKGNLRIKRSGTRPVVCGLCYTNRGSTNGNLGRFEGRTPSIAFIIVWYDYVNMRIKSFVFTVTSCVIMFEAARASSHSEILWQGWRTQFWEFPNSEKCILKRGLETNMMYFSVFVLGENWESWKIQFKFTEILGVRRGLKGWESPQFNFLNSSGTIDP